MNIKKKTKIITLLLVLISCLLFYRFKLNIEPIEKKQEIKTIDYNWSKEEFLKNYELNHDYAGNIRFESGLINLPFVQAIDNLKYLRRDWISGKYKEEGSVFMDSECNIDSYNITLYGHYVYPSLDPLGKEMFTPLHQLLDEEAFNKHKFLELLLKDEIRKYEISAVYFVHLVIDEDGYYYTEDDMQYYLNDFRLRGEEYLNDYKEAIVRAVSNNGGFSFIDSGVDFDLNDHLLTLQTCVRNREDLRLIVVSKEIERIKMDV